MILVSACLSGFCCTYNGKSHLKQKILDLARNGKAIPVCPEQLGGLPTPRSPVEILNGRFLTKDGKDVTDNFRKGAEEVLRFAKNIGADCAVLKSNSPSCGFGKIYDGTFSGTKTDGNGIAAQMLFDNGIKIISSDDF
ncbi:MAG: hypothetical protein CSB55_05350 [Candidatus Cloacimonadota bacterium]|nr:MAG: hypothetical protein CSB55_05350 [Candidatus Cloacimonadota bacterium]